MARKPTTPPHFPNKEQILEFIRESQTPVGRREIARAFKIKGSDRITLKQVMKEMAASGQIDPGRGRKVAPPGALPEISVLEIIGLNDDGELTASQAKWSADDGPEPTIIIMPENLPGPASKVGDRVLVRLSRVSDREYEARVIRRLEKRQDRIVGQFEKTKTGGRITPSQKGASKAFEVLEKDVAGAATGDLVAAVTLPRDRHGLRRAKVVEVFGSSDDPRSISLITMREQDIPYEFPDKVVEAAKAAKPVSLGKRTDLRDVPLVTIDGDDARDFDDAVWARADDDPKNQGGWRILVAIADVAHYVKPGSDLDREAYKRGNSVYFPDRVSPMLPEALSADLCSLRPNVERACMAVEMIIDKDGKKREHRFMRGLMRSAARLTYEQVQQARDTGLSLDLPEESLDGLYGAFQALEGARAKRGALDLDLPELKIKLDDSGEITSIDPRERLDSHRLIEEFMVLANVAAAETLEEKRALCMYRAHEEPDPQKVDALRENLQSLDIPLAKGQVLTANEFNKILARVKDTAHERMVNQLVLRCQSQAVYSPENPGHFGLALRRYAHFTSPIRRYSDLLVHRSLIGALSLGKDGLPPEAEAEFEEWGEHISMTERRAVVAERNAIDRYSARFLRDRVGARFEGRIAGVTRFGLFVTLDDTGADGLIPIGSLPSDYYDHDEKRHALVGRSSGRSFTLGQTVTVRLEEANPVSGGLVFSLQSGGSEGRPVAFRTRAPGNKRGKGKSKNARKTGSGSKSRGKSGKRR